VRFCVISNVDSLAYYMEQIFVKFLEFSFSDGL